jgi:hypothetical protein
MPTEDEKSEIEIMTFREFAKRHSLPIDLNSVEKRNPPEPDILCQNVDGSFVAFELAEICNNDLAKELNQPTCQFFWTSSRLPDILKKKISKVYRTIHPVDLLLYVDGREITPDNVIIPKIKYQVRSIRRSKIRFKRIWFLGRKQSYLVCDFT